MAMFVLNYWSRELLLSAFANRLELRCEPTDAIVLENLPLFGHKLSTLQPANRVNFSTHLVDV